MALVVNPVPVGLDGEIFVGGPTLAIGYLNRPEITAERFIASPPSVPDRHGPRLYRTGDVGRLLPSGELEIVGRCDSMQKVRGYSVELRAVQAAVQARPGVTACEVLVLGDEGTDKQLVAYVCLEDGMTPTGVRSAVKAVLPHYMIPSYVPMSGWRCNRRLASIPRGPAGCRLPACAPPFLPSPLLIDGHCRCRYFVEVQHMPMTPIGKLDKKALPNLEEIMEQAKERIKQDRDQAPTADEARMIALWKAVLGLNFVDLTESFFDLGGHSLLAAKLIGEIRREFKAPELTVVQLFAHPTVRALTAAVCGTDGEVPPPTDAQIDLPAEVAAHDYSRAEFSLLVRAFWRRERLYNKSNNGFANSVLLTGAGGFFGCFMLQSLLKTTAANVFCLIRPAPNLTALQKLRGRMQHYGLWEPGFAGRIELLNGNIELSKLGLTEDEYTFLGTHIDCVIHGAAKVNLVYPYTGLRQANVVGTQNVLKFCLRGKIKPLYYVSTNGVFPLGSTNCMEDGSIDDVHARLQDGYAQSKWVAEQLVRRAQKCGLPAVVFRPGNLSGPISHPAWNPNDFNHLLLTGCLRLGAVPVLAGWRLEMTPVNDAASFLVSTLGQVGLLGQTFHIVNPKAVPLSDFFADFPEEGPGSLRRLPYAEWRALLLASQDPSVAELQSAMEVLPDAAQVTKLSSFDTTNYAAVAAANGLELPQLGKRAIREYHRHFRERGITVQRQADPSRPLLGQVALVTGASSGIGRAIATALAKAGASVGLAARRLDRLEELSASLRATYGSRVCAVATDVTKRSEVKAFVAEACEKLGGPVDILVNNAGVMHYTKMGNLMEDQWEQAVDVNCKGVLNGIGAVLGPMLARGQGHIVNTSSDAGRKVFAGLAVYSGTKFFVEAVSQGLRLECAGTGVKVTTVQPGDCQTELAKCTTDEEARSEYARECWTVRRPRSRVCASERASASPWNLCTHPTRALTRLPCSLPPPRVLAAPPSRPRARSRWLRRCRAKQGPQRLAGSRGCCVRRPLRRVRPWPRRDQRDPHRAPGCPRLVGTGQPVERGEQKGPRPLLSLSVSPLAPARHVNASPGCVEGRNRSFIGRSRPGKPGSLGPGLRRHR